MSHRRAIEDHLFATVSDLFGLRHTVALIDLTNTFFEGAAAKHPKAQPRPLEGEAQRLPAPDPGPCARWQRLRAPVRGLCRHCRRGPPRWKEMLSTLEAPRQALVVMDAGAATADNVVWLRDRGYRSLVVSRERVRRFDPDLAEAIETRWGRRCVCTASSTRRRERGACTAIPRNGRTRRRASPIASRRASRAPSPGCARGCRVRAPARGSTMSGEASGGSASAAAASHSSTSSMSPRIPRPARRWRSPGRRSRWPGPCSPIRASIAWRPLSSTGTRRPCGVPAPCSPTWIPVFRSLKSELGLRPVYQQTQGRADGHLFITVLAYQLVQTIRGQLREHGETSGWATLRRILAGQQRVTATFRRKDGTTLHPRKATLAEPAQLKIYTALGLDPQPGKVLRMVVRSREHLITDTSAPPLTAGPTRIERGTTSTACSPVDRPLTVPSTHPDPARGWPRTCSAEHHQPNPRPRSIGKRTLECACRGQARSGGATSVTPIIASLPTRAASSASERPSVPSGRIGSTR